MGSWWLRLVKAVGLVIVGMALLEIAMLAAGVPGTYQPLLQLTRLSLHLHDTFVHVVGGGSANGVLLLSRTIEVLYYYLGEPVKTTALRLYHLVVHGVAWFIDTPALFFSTLKTEGASLTVVNPFFLVYLLVAAVALFVLVLLLRRLGSWIRARQNKEEGEGRHGDDDDGSDSSSDTDVDELIQESIRQQQARIRHARQQQGSNKKKKVKRH